MKRTYRICVGVVALVLIVFMANTAAQSKPANAQQATPTATEDAASELPADAMALTIGTPVTATLDPNTSIKFYTFTGKAQQKIQVDLQPKSGDFFTTLTVTTTDLQTIIAGTLGEAVIGGNLLALLPADGQYAISVEYDSVSGNNAPSGSYQLEVYTFTEK